jgi:hypothetical protein
MFKPSSDPSREFRSLLLMVSGMIFHKEKIKCMQWCHTEGSGAENDLFLC